MFVLRTHDQAAASSNHRVLSPLALVTPALAVLTLVGLISVQDRYEYEAGEEDNDARERDCLTGIHIDEGDERDCLTGMPLEERRHLLCRIEEGECDYDDSTVEVYAKDRRTARWK